MSIEKEFEKRGIELSEDNSLPKGSRTQKDFKRVIAAVRAAEAAYNDDLHDANERCRKVQDQLLEARERIRELEAKLLRSQLERTLSEGEFEKLTTADRTKLLEFAAA